MIGTGHGCTSTSIATSTTTARRKGRKGSTSQSIRRTRGRIVRRGVVTVVRRGRQGSHGLIRAGTGTASHAVMQGRRFGKEGTVGPVRRQGNKVAARAIVARMS